MRRVLTLHPNTFVSEMTERLGNKIKCLSDKNFL